MSQRVCPMHIEPGTYSSTLQIAWVSKSVEDRPAHTPHPPLVRRSLTRKTYYGNVFSARCVWRGCASLSFHTLFTGDMSLNDTVNIFWNICWHSFYGRHARPSQHILRYCWWHNWDTYFQYSCTVSEPQLCQIQKIWSLLQSMKVNIFSNIFWFHNRDTYFQHSCTLDGPWLCQVVDKQVAHTIVVINLAVNQHCSTTGPWNFLWRRQASCTRIPLSENTLKALYTAID